MPPRKRSNWRQPTIFDDNEGGRRTTRAARSSASGQNSSKSSQYLTKDGVTINMSRSKERVQGWVEVWRSPSQSAGFQIPIWVRMDQLTEEEKEEYLRKQEESSNSEQQLQDSNHQSVDKPECSNNEPMHTGNAGNASANADQTVTNDGVTQNNPQEKSETPSDQKAETADSSVVEKLETIDHKNSKAEVATPVGENPGNVSDTPENNDPSVAVPAGEEPQKSDMGAESSELEEPAAKRQRMQGPDDTNMPE